MKEKDFQSWVVQTAEAFGWRVWHVPMPMRPIPGGKFVPAKTGRGLPDLIMFHANPPRLIFAELKGDGGTTSEDQREFLRLARGVVGIALVDGNTLDGYGAPDATRPIGAFSWRPGDEAVVELVLRSKVLT